MYVLIAAVQPPARRALPISSITPAMAKARISLLSASKLSDTFPVYDYFSASRNRARRAANIYAAIIKPPRGALTMKYPVPLLSIKPKRVIPPRRRTRMRRDLVTVPDKTSLPIRLARKFFFVFIVRGLSPFAT